MKDPIKTVVSVLGGNIPTKQQLPPAKIVPVVISLLMLVKPLNNMMILKIVKCVLLENTIPSKGWMKIVLFVVQQQLKDQPNVTMVFVMKEVSKTQVVFVNCVPKVGLHLSED
jgi:hypothetical protein